MSGEHFDERDPFDWLPAPSTPRWNPDIDEEPPTSVTFSLDEALTLLAALEDAAATAAETDRLSGEIELRELVGVLHDRLGLR